MRLGKLSAHRCFHVNVLRCSSQCKKDFQPEIRISENISSVPWLYLNVDSPQGLRKRAKKWGRRLRISV